MLMEYVGCVSLGRGVGVVMIAVEVGGDEGPDIEPRGERGGRIQSKPRRRQSPQLGKLDMKEYSRWE